MARLVFRGLAVLLAVMTLLHLWSHGSEGYHGHVHHDHDVVSMSVEKVSMSVEKAAVDRPAHPPSHHDHQLHPDRFVLWATSLRMCAEHHMIGVMSPPGIEDARPPVYGLAIERGRAPPPYGHRSRARQTNTLAVWRC